MIRWLTPGVCLWVGWTVSGDQMNNSRGLSVGLVDCVSDSQLQWPDCQGARLVALFVCVQDRPCSL